ncbi:hypothetical protein EV122DRAFT_220444 [Schizophyllum commune]
MQKHERGAKAPVKGTPSLCQTGPNNSDERHAAHLQVFPSHLAVGTSSEPNMNMVADSTRYDPSCERSLASGYAEQFPFDVKKVQTTPYRRLEYLVNSLEPGVLCVASRGRALAIAAGYHCAVVSFGREGSMHSLPRSDYDEIIKCDAPGSDSTESTVELVRQFNLSSQFITPHSVGEDGDREKGRALRMPMAFVTDDHAYVFTDHTREIRIFVISLSRHWTPEDLSPGSTYWDHHLWKPFNMGPDWFYEKSQALDLCERWRREHPRYFANWGPHLMNDSLHCLGLFPGTPGYLLCQDDDQFAAFKQGLSDYVDQFYHFWYHQRFCHPTNDDNPLAFQHSVDTQYTSSHLRVFRKGVVPISTSTYNRHIRRGDFDPRHIMGQPYKYKPSNLLSETLHKHIAVPVYFRGGKLEAFTVIRAQVPSEGGWTDGPEEPAVDFRIEGCRSLAVGPANAYETRLNKLEPIAAMANLKRGRPRLVSPIFRLIPS